MQPKQAGTIHAILSLPVVSKNVFGTRNAHVEKIFFSDENGAIIIDFQNLLLQCKV